MPSFVVESFVGQGEGRRNISSDGEAKGSVTCGYGLQRNENSHTVGVERQTRACIVEMFCEDGYCALSYHFPVI